MLLVDIEANPRQSFLVKLHTKELVKEVKRLISNRRYSQAIMWAIFHGKIEGELAQKEILGVGADLIITKESARWDLTGK